MNPRAVALYGVLCQPGEKLCVMVWDSWAVQIEKPGNHKDQRATWSTKIHGNAMSRLEASDLEGHPVFTLPLSASISPRATDESTTYHILLAEDVADKRGGLSDVLVPPPGYCVMHLGDNGFR